MRSDLGLWVDNQTKSTYVLSFCVCVYYPLYLALIILAFRCRHFRYTADATKMSFLLLYDRWREGPFHLGGDLETALTFHQQCCHFTPWNSSLSTRPSKGTLLSSAPRRSAKVCGQKREGTDGEGASNLLTRRRRKE